ncbi:MAG: NAD-dependent DNA ligase LigA [Lachnospiraceae bacterium]
MEIEQTKMERMKKLVDLCNQASKAYYQEAREIMSNLEYDALYDELQVLEKETGVVLSQSPTIHVGYELLSELPKEAHESSMLSLDKTKDIEELSAWLGDHEGLLSWKMDGLTIVLTYRDGTLYKAVTRGNGEIGEVVTNNARVFKNVPLSISYTGELILRGEAVIRYSDFERINEELADVEEKYKNPRNLCSGSVRQLNNEVTANRSVCFYAFSLVKADGVDFHNSRAAQMEWLREQGFDVVYYEKVTGDTVASAVITFAGMVTENDLPSDGLVLTLEDIAYGQSLGRTAKFPRDSIAFKWTDELKETKLTAIEWSPSRTGLINPVAIFEPVQLEGTTVSRASVHNVSILKSLALGIGDRITVYKANMIIPQINENLSRTGPEPCPAVCPVCGGPTEIRKTTDVESLYCINPDCLAKRTKSLALFVSRDAMNMDGLSEATLEKFIGAGFLHDFSDLFRLSEHQEEIVAMDGFGQKSYDNLIAAIEKARNTTLPRLIYALGIANIGPANAKMLCKAFDYDIEKLRHATKEELTEVDGVGDVIAEGICSYFADPKNNELLDHLLAVLHVEKPELSEGGKRLDGQIFVITGSLEHFQNRKELQERIEALGGKVTGSVTGKTSYLVNNDVNSSSSKNRKARELGVPILSEEEMIRLLGE